MRRAVGMGMCLALGMLLCGLLLAQPASGEVLLPDPSLSGFTNGVVEPDYEGVLRVWPGPGPGPFVQKFVFVVPENITSKKMVFDIMERVLTARPSQGGMPAETLQDVAGTVPRAPRLKATMVTPAGVVVTLKGVQICGLAHTPLLDGKPPSRVYFNDCLQTALRPVCPVANVTSVVAEVPANGIPAGSTVEFLVGLPPIPAAETGPVIGCVVPGVDSDNPCDSSVTLCYTAPKPDLVVQGITLRTNQVTQGAVLAYSYTVANSGGEGPAGVSTFDVSTYLSTDQILDASDVELGWGYSAWTFHLDVGWSHTVAEDDVIIAAAPGTYYLIVLADAKPGLPPNYYPGVEESNETNNWRASAPFTVLSAP